MTLLSIDLETRSAVDLKKSGAHRYFEDATTDIWLACYAFDDEPVEMWWPTEPCPVRVAEHIRSGAPISGWNVGFERLGFELILGPRYGWPVPPPIAYHDTAALAAAMSLPRDLAGASAALGLPVQKDMDGKALMMRMARPRTKSPLTWWNDAERLQRLAAYCVVDVETEREARKRLVDLSDDERAIWLLDAKINARGIRIDIPLAESMMAIVDQATARLNAEMTEATGGYVTAASQVATLTRWLQERGVAADSLAKAALSELLDLDDVPPECRRALEIRKEAAKASTAKLKAAMACTSREGRAHGLLLYHGAGTGRWAGRLFQPHNLPRGAGVVKNAEKAAPFMAHGDADLIRMLYGQPLAAVSDCLRSVICAAPGHDLLAADFSAIEGRVTAWLAGEEWKLDAFRANDETIGYKPDGKRISAGPGMYELTGAGIFGLDVAAVTKAHIARQVGKVAELALGFAGGVNAFWSMAKNYPDVKMETAFAPLWNAADDERQEKVERRYEKSLKRGEHGTDKMSREAWIASELTKLGWREKHPATAAMWAALEDGAREAVISPGTVVHVLKVAFVVARGFLWMRLPSGRCLAYGAPRIRLQVWVRHWNRSENRFDDDSEIMAKDHAEDLARINLVKIERQARSSVTALGVNSTTRKWERFALYGGLIAENAVQAIARDLMAAAMLRAEAAGYPIVLTVHDEIIAEPAETFGDVREFERLICELPAWAAGLPLTASGWRGKRYRKD